MDNYCIYAHEAILKQCSSYVDKVLLPNCDEKIHSDPFGKIIILMPDISSKSLKEALNIIYLGRSNNVCSYSEVAEADYILQTIFGMRFVKAL